MGVETQFPRGEKLGGKNDLAHVLGEMFDDMVDRFEDRNVIILDLDSLGKPGVAHSGNDLIDCRNSLG